jgi:hypothetical protein
MIRTRSLLGAIAAAAVLAPLSSAFAGNNNVLGEAGDVPMWLAQISQSRSAVVPASRQPSALFGSPADAGRADRTVTVAPGTRYIAVNSGETVGFVVGGQTVAWQFAETTRNTTVDLGLLLNDTPAAKGVKVNIKRSKLYAG